MAEYIERRAAHDAVVDAIWHGKRSMYSVAGAINSVPTADVAPVVHGRWILVDTWKGIGVCSNCNRQDRIDHLATHCRFCGARMNDA